ncbi:hypothetical protein DH2020_044932 [Rehmannia glutinosa]|uniref:Uncharacterized protein n=1 Tax=Rehmannia glutinosa TaxID=99300 RepID=A0ABR0UGN9_REHGL
MGACASVPKANRGDDTVAPPPELPKEETPATEAPAPATAVKEAEGGEDKKEEKTVDESSTKRERGRRIKDRGTSRVSTGHSGGGKIHRCKEEEHHHRWLPPKMEIE